MTSLPRTENVDTPSREQLLYWLHEASEIEHQLMCCYLYAAFSLKRTDPTWSAAQRDAVARWRDSIMSVVFEEMSHFALVANLVNAIGATPHMNRSAFPVDAGPYPAGFVIRLQPFSLETVEHFKYLERPSSEALSDGQGYVPARDYRRVVPAGRLSPGPRDYETVGELYDVLSASLDACVTAYGESFLFIGDARLQVDGTLAPLTGVVAVTDLASAQQAITTIVTQGEGAGSESSESHFCRFSRIAVELSELKAADPSFEPAWAAATNPVMNKPVHSATDRVHIAAPNIARWLDIANAIYTTSLRCLLQGFSSPDRKAKATWLDASFALMRMLVPLGQGLASRPASAELGSPNAGLTFTPLRTLAVLPAERAAAYVAERLAQLHARASELPFTPVAGETAATWSDVVDLLARQHAALIELARRSGPASVAPPLTHAPSSGSQPGVSSSGPPANGERAVERIEGRALTILYRGERCIHSRHCVLDAPQVFLANTPGTWIRPDAADAENLTAVVRSCPSGALSYEREDGGAVESAPLVNQMRVRENGPYAFHAELIVADTSDGYRATLCRCGASANKPWCDGSHVNVGFAATGEVVTRASAPLDMRNGALRIDPLRNGPLRATGALEVCTGTGRTIAKVNDALFCRCGHSHDKPFCDGSHRAAGFTADGR